MQPSPVREVLSRKVTNSYRFVVQVLVSSTTFMFAVSQPGSHNRHSIRAPDRESFNVRPIRSGRCFEVGSGERSDTFDDLFRSRNARNRALNSQQVGSWIAYLVGDVVGTVAAAAVMSNVSV